MHVLAYIFLFFCFFPYLSLLGLGNDTQPNAIIVGCILLFGLKEKKINPPIILLLILFFASLFLIFHNQLSTFSYVKNSMNYLAPPIVAFVSYNLFLKMKTHIPFKWFMGILFTYFLVGFVQLHFIPDFMISFLSRGEVLFGGRGVISLNPEPAFYATMCLFLMIFSLITYNKRENIIAISFLLFQMIYLARSATGFAILGFALLLFIVFQILRLRLKYFALGSMIAITLFAGFHFGMKKIEETRFGLLANAFIDNPMMITQFDASTGVRVTGAIAPFISYKHHYMMPMGLGYYKEFLKGLYVRGQYRKLLNEYIVFEKDRIGGSINLVMFQLGFIGLLFPLAVYLAFRSLLYKDSHFFAFILFMTILFTQIQLMQSMIGFLIGYSIYRSGYDRRDTLAHAES